MVNKNEEYVVNIVDQGIKGEGIAKINGFTIFIPNVLKNEKVKIKILKVMSSHAFGKCLEIIEKSNSRIEKDCETFEKCGGCNLRHINYKDTLVLKKESVINTLRKEIEINFPINDCVGMENPLYYRNKLQYPVRSDVNGKYKMGVFRERTHEIIETRSCKIQNEESQEIANFIISFLEKEKVPAYSEENQSGYLRHIVIRNAIKTNEIMVTLVINASKMPKEEELTRAIVEKFDKVKTVVKNINTKNTNVILSEKNEILYGKGYIFEILDEYKFKISPLSFFQVNPVQTEKLYKKAVEYANLEGYETIFDLYCGIGTIGIFASKNAKKLYGIETIEDAIKDARENAELNNIKNAEFFVGDVEKKLPSLLQEKDIKADVVFIDPPRKGCDKTALDTLLKIEPKKIVYISCNPATLARDLKILNEKYTIAELTPFDLFPFTRTC